MIPPVLITVYSDGVRLFVEHVVLFLTVISVQYAYFVKQNNFYYDLCGQFMNNSRLFLPRTGVPLYLYSS